MLCDGRVAAAAVQDGVLSEELRLLVHRAAAEHGSTRHRTPRARKPIKAQGQEPWHVLGQGQRQLHEAMPCLSSCFLDLMVGDS